MDVLRAMIADWESHPIEAGIRTRDLAVTMISDHLVHGYDVIVPQFLSKATFADRLNQTATTAGARFVEVALVETYKVAERRFFARAERARQSEDTRATHGPLGADSMQELFERHHEFIDTRQGILRVTPIDGDPETSLDRLRTAIDSHDAGL
jgi:hypothetical protein